MAFHVIIPARLQSSRLPRKVILDIGGKPMLQRVYEQACKSEALSVAVATDNQEIYQLATSWGAKVCMTAEHHPSGTDRLAEAISHLGYASSDIIVNVQGDEPFIPPQSINQVAQLLIQHTNASMATLKERLDKIEMAGDANVVKVVANQKGEALYFSRAPIPWNRQQFSLLEFSKAGGTVKDMYRHIGLYAYRAHFVQEFVTWLPSPLEQLEQLEQLRALYYGHTIMVAEAVATSPIGVDTEADLAYARALASTLLSDSSHGFD